MDALPTDLPAEILTALAQKPSADAREFRVDLTKFIMLLDQLSTKPEIPRDVTGDDLRRSAEFFDALTPLFQGVTMAIYRSAVVLLAPEMLPRFERAILNALVGIRVHAEAIRDALERIRHDRVRKAHALVAREHDELFRRLAQ